MKRFIERLVNSLILMGFFVFSGGVLYTIFTQSRNYGLPLEITIVIMGLALILLGFLAAQIFSEVESFE